VQQFGRALLSRFAVLGFCISVIYWPGLLGAALVPRWAAIAVGVPLASRLDPREVEARYLWLLGAPLVSIVILRCPSLDRGAQDLLFLCFLGLAFIAAAGLKSLDGVMTGLALGAGVSGVLCVAQLFGWSPVGQISVPAGLFWNSEALAEFAAPVAVWAILARSPLVLPAVLPVLLCHSRTALLASALGLLYAWEASWRAKMLAAFFVAVAASAALFWRLPSASERIEIWQAAISGMTWLGNGLGSFAAAYPRYDTAHSDGLQMLFELGPAGVLWFLIPILLLTERRRSRGERATLVAIIVQACISFPLHQPAAGFVAAVVVGFLAGRRRGLCGQQSCGRDYHVAGDGAVAAIPFRDPGRARPRGIFLSA
jgi:hypothetical protein